jgi:hypothetical protein
VLSLIRDGRYPEAQQIISHITEISPLPELILQSGTETVTAVDINSP